MEAKGEFVTEEAAMIDSHADPAQEVCEPLPPLPLDEWEAELGDWESQPGASCNATRPGTLGYQRCWLPKHHDGHSHESQDGERW